MTDRCADPTKAKQEFAAARSHQDIAHYNQGFSTSANILFALNGGGAVALLTFYADVLAQSGTVCSLATLGVVEIGYVVGAILTSIALRNLGENSRQWSYGWEFVVQNPDKSITDGMNQLSGTEFSKPPTVARIDIALGAMRRARTSIKWSLVLFIASTVVATAGLSVANWPGLAERCPL